MQFRKSAIAAMAALVTTLAVATPASAAWRGHGGWHHGGGWGGAGVGLGFATGAIVGSALAAPRYYGGYGYGYGPYAAYDDAYEESYAAAPAYSGGDGRDDAYCAQRFKSYDPGSGTYLGYDGARHPCP